LPQEITLFGGHICTPMRFNSSSIATSFSASCITMLSVIATELWRLVSQQA
jgi:hypothetical protein